MEVSKAYEWFANLTYLEQHKLTDKYFNSVNPTRLANGQVLEIYIEEQVNVINTLTCGNCGSTKIMRDDLRKENTCMKCGTNNCC